MELTRVRRRRSLGLRGSNAPRGRPGVLLPPPRPLEVSPPPFPPLDRPRRRRRRRRQCGLRRERRPSLSLDLRRGLRSGVRLAFARSLFLRRRFRPRSVEGGGFDARAGSGAGADSDAGTVFVGDGDSEFGSKLEAGVESCVGAGWMSRIARDPSRAPRRPPPFSSAADPLPPPSPPRRARARDSPEGSARAFRRAWTHSDAAPSPRRRSPPRPPGVSCVWRRANPWPPSSSPRSALTPPPALVS